MLGDSALKHIFFQQSMCCGYGPDGMGSAVGYDCVFIPGASKAATVNVLAPNAYCGKSAGLVSVKGDATKNKTICSKLKKIVKKGIVH